MPPSASRSQTEADSRRNGDRDQARQHHLAKRSGRRDIHTLGVVRFAGAFHQAGNFAELPADLLHHRHGCLTHGSHRDGRDQEGHQAADEHADQYVRVIQSQVDTRTAGGGVNRFHEGGDDRECRQRGSADCEAFTHGRRGVAEFVQRVGNRPGVFTQPCHFSDTARVIRDRAVGINRHGHAHRGEQADRGDADAIETRPARSTHR